LISEIGDAYEPAKALYVTEPIADLLFISGLALNYSELDGNSVRTIVEQTWDRFLDQVGDESQLLSWLVAIGKLRDSIFMVPPYESVRTNLKQRLERRLRTDGLLSDYLSDYPRRKTSDVSHTSPLIRALVGRSSELRSDPEDVFVVAYLHRRPSGGTLTLTSQQQFFQSELGRAETGDDSADDEELW
jgi:hypothetical protein